MIKKIILSTVTVATLGFSSASASSDYNLVAEAVELLIMQTTELKKNLVSNNKKISALESAIADYNATNTRLENRVKALENKKAPEPICKCDDIKQQHTADIFSLKERISKVEKVAEDANKAAVIKAKKESSVPAPEMNTKKTQAKIDSQAERLKNYIESTKHTSVPKIK